jgi:hypothetical protein
MTATIDLTINGGTTATTPELKEMQDRVATRLCQLADCLGSNCDPATSIAMACTLLEDDFESLQLAGVPFLKFAFEATATRAVMNLDDPRDMRDDSFRQQFTDTIIELVQLVSGPLERGYKARLATTRLAEARIAARLDVGAGLTEADIEEEYSQAASFITEQLKAAPHKARRRPDFSIDAE